ncbi:hypothetical protein OSTOST_06122 [Ostertagia ostertagi]
MLTQEELDHIAYIQRLAEETSVAPPPRPAPPSVDLRKDSFAKEESRDESEATSGADQVEASDAGSPVPLYERTSPLLEEEEKPVTTTSFVPSEPMLTQEELDHIAYIQRLAEETSVAPPPRPAPPDLRKDSFAKEESRDESEATSGADQVEASDAGSPVPLYERTSPLLEEEEKPVTTTFDQVDHDEAVQPGLPSRPPLPSWATDEDEIAVKAAEIPSEPMLTQEELDHIAYIQRLAEETSVAPPPRPALLSRLEKGLVRKGRIKR